MSYLEHFSLRGQPFSEHTPGKSLWNDSRLEEGLSRLQHLVQCGVLGLVTGASGLGKSALLKRFIAEQSPQVCHTIYCHLAHLPANGLLKCVLGQLGEVPKRGKEKLYSQIMDRAAQIDGVLLLVFDEAHLLSGDALVDPAVADLVSDRGRPSAENTVSRSRAHPANAQAIGVRRKASTGSVSAINCGR